MDTTYNILEICHNFAKLRKIQRYKVGYFETQ